MRDVEVVTCFLLRRTEKGDEVLVLRRSERVGTYRGKWAGVSGYLEPGASAVQQAEREMEEETGLSREDARLVRQGEPLEVVDPSASSGQAPPAPVRWMVHPFLFEVVRGALPSARKARLKTGLRAGETEEVRLDWEHVEARWVRPEEVRGLETVPGLAEALTRVYAEQGRKSRGAR